MPEDSVSKEWRLLSRAERERRVMSRLLLGDAIPLRVSEAATGRGDPNGKGRLPHRASEMLQDWKQRGLIGGVVPLLTEDGRKYFDGLGSVIGGLVSESGEAGKGMDTTGSCPYCHKPIPDHASVKCSIRVVSEVTTEVGSAGGD